MRILPIVFVKELIYKCPLNYQYLDIPSNIKVIDLNQTDLKKYLIDDEIYKYCMFRVHKGYKGIGLIHSTTNEFIGYGFYSNLLAPPTNIPRIPQNSGWLFNTLIIEKYRGNGYQKLLISERIKRLKSDNQHVNIYTDIIESNIGSRKSFIKSGFKEFGIYYIMVLGIRRYSFLNLKIGYWNKSKKHKQL